jgi:hypothetical protein
VKFTDYVLTIDGPYDDDAWDYIEHEVLPALQRITKREVNMSSHECNDDGETFHSVKAERDELRDEHGWHQPSLPVVDVPTGGRL